VLYDKFDFLANGSNVVATGLANNSKY